MNNIPVWDDGGWQSLPPLTSDVETDVCVVGLGGSGLSALRELHKLGVRPIGIDAGQVAGGAAGRNGGFLLAGLAHFHHDAVARLGEKRAYSLYLHTLIHLEDEFLPYRATVAQTGSLRIADSQEEYDDCERQFRAMQPMGIDMQWYFGPEGEGLVFHKDAVFQPLRHWRALASELLAEGVALFENTPALTLSGNQVKTTGGTIHCHKVIVAVDGKLEVILPELTGRVRTARLQMLATEPVQLQFRRPVYSRYGYDYWQQLPDGRIAIGGYRDHFRDEEWTADTTPTTHLQDRLETHLREKLEIHAPITHRWGASVAYTEDGLPILEEVRPGVWAIGAYSGTGNIVGSLCGQEVAKLVAGKGSEWARLLRGDPVPG